MPRTSRLPSVFLISCVIVATGNVFAWSLKEAPVMSRWAELVDPQNTLPEYPRPQMMRTNWLNLNGLWQYQPGAAQDAVPTGQNLTGEILVPFPVESAISGVMEHHDRLWYRREFTVPTGWAGQRILLHFGAVDWESQVYVNGQSAGLHQGGYDSFFYDITSLLTGSGPQELIVRVYDPTDNAGIARGKQTLYAGGIMYTSCTGIWQTVWLEPVPQISIAEIKLVPDVDHSRLNVTGFASQSQPNLTLEATAYANGQPVGSVRGGAGEELHLVLRAPQLWSPQHPFLYDLTVTLKQGQTVLDQVDSYFGMRKISLGTVDGILKMLLNNEFVFHMGPLDQGFWPDGIYRAPTDEALKFDIEQTLAMGFNMTRKHIKVEPERWYYWCDKLGLMVWQDMPSMNSYIGGGRPVPPIDAPQYKTELTRMVKGHWNHPSIVMWVIFNESQGQHDTQSLCQFVKETDPSRLVNQASGGTHHGAGDVLDIHSYPPPGCPTSSTQARACGEYGGIGMRVTGHMWNQNSWGYTMVNSPEELAARYDSYSQMLSAFKTNQGLSAAVYTQITDVEIEINGLMTYDRDVIKADTNSIRISNLLYDRTYEDVMQTSEQTPQTWRYTTAAPNADWYTTTFNDSSWNEGAGGFGTSGTPGSAVGTAWNTSDIWLRRTFNPGTLSPEDLDKLVWRIHHDEDADVYINGTLALSRTGYTTSYVPIQVDAAAKAALVQNSTNVMAVRCHQTGGGQFIDVGLSLETIHLPTETCGQWGYAPADLNRNCRVDLNDMAVLAVQWMNGGQP